jgi:nicotinamidase-related amidase
MSITLLLIDVQKDFHPGGSLAIASAGDDSDRIAQFIELHAERLDRIVCTLDSHLKLHLANPGFWYDRDYQNHPNPFTIISADDIRKGVWKPRKDLRIPAGSIDPVIFPASIAAKIEYDELHQTLDLTNYCIEYAERLEAAGRFQICIWPEHCLMGSPGHGFVDRVRIALDRWSETTGRSVEIVHKGQNILTEMYSALAADVPISRETAMNTELRTSLLSCRTLLVCGQALSHCVNYTVRDIVGDRNKGVPDIQSTDIIVLTDCSSPVSGFETAAACFCEDMKKAGVRFLKSTDLDIFSPE